MPESCSSNDIPAPTCCGSAAPSAGGSPLDHFRRMIPNCLAYAKAAKAKGRPIVGIFCEYTPREVIMAAGAVPVCMCGGSEATISAGETELPANLCPLVKSSYGYVVQGSNPFLEMADLLVAETTCDAKKKMYELLAERKPMHILELPQKSDTDAARKHWRSEVLALKDGLEERFGTLITDARLRQAIATMNRERKLRRRIAECMAADNPPLTGKDILLIKSSISGICEDLSQYERLLESLATQNPPPTDRVRVLLTGVPMPHGAERVLDIIEEAGGLVVCQETCTGLKPLLDDVDETAADPLDAIAQKYLDIPCSCMTPNTRRFEMLDNLVAQYRPEAIVELVWMACHTYNVEAERVGRMAEQKWQLPYLKIETDYSPADTARISVRVEATLELAKQNRGQARP